MTTLRDELLALEAEMRREVKYIDADSHKYPECRHATDSGKIDDWADRLAALANAPDPAGFTAADMMAARKEERERLQGGEKPPLSAQEINALPEHIRKYIMWLETDADPAGTLQENFRLTEENAALRILLAHPAAASVEVDEAMVERALFAYLGHTDYLHQETRDRMRAAIAAAMKGSAK